MITHNRCRHPPGWWNNYHRISICRPRSWRYPEFYSPIPTSNPIFFGGLQPAVVQFPADNIPGMFPHESDSGLRTDVGAALANNRRSQQKPGLQLAAKFGQSGRCSPGMYLPGRQPHNLIMHFHLNLVFDIIRFKLFPLTIAFITLTQA